MQKNKSLEILKEWSAAENIAVVGGGPSLDLCHDDIRDLLKKDTLFLLSDIVSQKFITEFPQSKRLIFTVEQRNHGYLRTIENEKIAMYIYARRNNLNCLLNKVYNFHFDFDNNISHKESFQMKSAGTVSGSAIYWALYVTLSCNQVKSIYLLGIDLYYIDNQVYSKMCNFSHKRNYFDNRETRELNAIFKKSSIFLVSGNFLVKTSIEFNKTRENLNILLEKYKDMIPIYDFSPLGVDSGIVKKIIPAKIKSELSAT